MELVQGVSITDYCDRNSLGTKDRLRLFLQVCQAVQHAHQKGIIHRDIKPSNVMVTHHDGRPIPKVIDFGIAKATNQKLTEKTLFTRYAHLIGTPAYMSPEQAELSDLDIDTRSDIYSLGVLLYELLTGTTPFSEEELRQADYLEMQRVIREQEPVKPSTRIKTAWRGHLALASRGHPARESSEAPDQRAAARPARHEEQGRDALATKDKGGTPMLREVRGDLDWIVMKTLEKDRSRRYDTASGLAEDIRRHLESEPVLARAPSAAYRLRKFLRRNHARVLVALGMAALAIATAVLLWQWHCDRQRLDESQGLREEAILSQAREQYARADRKAALETIGPIQDSRHVGPETRLLKAGILVDDRRFEEAQTLLMTLLQERREVAGTAYSLLARSLWESETLDAEKLRQIKEYRQKAEGLLPRTAEAYYLRAMTAVTVREQLAALNEALALDPDHYESLRLRAFTHYASRRYRRMSDDALGMTYLRRGDPLGYSLRALALRELGQYEEAVTEYDHALARMGKEEPQYVDLSTQRCETFLRMGDYERAIAAAQEGRKSFPDKSAFRYHLFSALTALGEYERAAAVFQEIVRSAPTARNELWFWATKYVFDTLETGRSWHPSGFEPMGAAFLPLVEAEETYRDLRSKAHRVVTNGFSAQWSPDGRKLAFSLGVHGYSGVALYDPATQETELLIVPGKDPRWSPDGQYLAFVRDRQALRLEELTSAERKDQERWPANEEIWVMKSDGTEPRRLARGGWPSWSRDSTQVYYHSRQEKMLCSTSIASSEVEPKRIMACPSAFPSVSPDEQHVAYLEYRSLKVEHLVSHAVVAQWRAPFDPWGGPVWSPTSQEVCLDADSSVGDGTGLWIYPLGGNEPTKVLTGQIMAASWAPDGTKLVFALRPPYFELWTVDLDPGVSTVQALGPGRTLADHWQDMLRLYARRIETDPQDAYAYAERARCYGHLHERTKAEADMQRWSAVVNGGSPSDSWFDTLHANFTFGTPVNIQSTFPSLDPTPDEFIACFSADGLEVYCESAHKGGQGGLDLWVYKRASVEDDWGSPENLGPMVNSASTDWGASITSDGLELYFSSNRPGGCGATDIYVTRRATRTSPWGPPANPGSQVNGSLRDQWPSVSSDGRELYVSSNRPGGLGESDLYVSKRATIQDPWGDPVNLGPAVNSPFPEIISRLSPDGLLLFFHSPRPGRFGKHGDGYAARRASCSAPWQPAVNLGPLVNATPFNWPVGCPDGWALYIVGDPKDDGGNWIYQVPILPIVDFNADGKVDAKDLDMLRADWGKSNSVCDIGPYAWGDDKVDLEDQKVFMTYYERENPSAQP